MTRRFHSLIGLTVSSLLCLPAPAAACSSSACRSDQFVPFAGDLPANAVAFAFFPGAAEGDGGIERSTGAQLAFNCTDALGAERNVAFGVELRDRGPSLLQPDGPLVEGERCSIIGNACGLAIEGLSGSEPVAGTEYLSGRAEVRVTAAAPLPSELGSLELGEPRVEQLELSTSGGSCSLKPRACVVRVALVLSEQAMPWRDALLYETVVDGERWYASQNLVLQSQQGGSYLGRGKELFYAVLDAAKDEVDNPGLAPGPHRVVLRATLPGTTVTLETAPVTLELDCGVQGDASRPMSQQHDGDCTVSEVRPGGCGDAWAWLALLCAVVGVRARRFLL